jgi:hypothetical protein
MEMRIFVGRDDELSRVDRLLRDDSDRRRMAIVPAAKDMGKTALLDEIWDRYHTDTAVVFIDIGKEYAIPSLVNEIAGQLRSWGLQLSDNPSPATQPVTVQLIDVKARNSPTNIDIAFNNTVSSREEADRLLESLLAKIDAAPGPLRQLVLIDQYEKAEAPLQNWLNTSLVPRLLSRNATICVVAGRNEPSLTIAQKEQTYRLPLPKLGEEDIDRWLDAAGVVHTRENAVWLLRLTQGIPGEINECIIKLINSEGGGENS